MRNLLLARILVLALAVVALGAALSAAPAARQSAPVELDLSALAGWREWPLHEPGDLALDSERLGMRRWVMDGIFGPPGQGYPVTMYLDVFRGWFEGRSAFVLQWTSSGNPDPDNGSASIDTLIVDGETFRIRQRIQAGPGGAYDIDRHTPEAIYRTGVAADGSAERVALEGAYESFDFAAFPFLFPLLELREGASFRLPNVGTPTDLTPRVLAVHVAGEIDLVAADGGRSRVWDVQVMPPHERALIHFYVTAEPPWFHGWDYRLVDGRRVSTMRLWESTALTSRDPRARS